MRKNEAMYVEGLHELPGTLSRQPFRDSSQGPVLDRRDRRKLLTSVQGGPKTKRGSEKTAQAALFPSSQFTTSSFLT